jgi:hypothetical protein
VQGGATQNDNRGQMSNVFFCLLIVYLIGKIFSNKNKTRSFIMCSTNLNIVWPSVRKLVQLIVRIEFNVIFLFILKFTNFN